MGGRELSVPGARQPNAIELAEDFGGDRGAEEKPGEWGSVPIGMKCYMPIILPNYPGNLVKRSEDMQLLDVRATREVVGDANLEQDGGQAVGKIDVRSGAAAVRRSGDSAREPTLIFRPYADAEARSEDGIKTATKGKYVVARIVTGLVEIRCRVKGASASHDFQIRIVASVGPMVTGAILERPLFGRGVLLNGD